MIFLIIEMVAHFIVVLFTSFVVYTAWPGSSLFSWHPTLMVVAFTFLMVEAILAFSPESSMLSKAEHKTKVMVHKILQILCGVCAATGVSVIVYNKILHNKPHFTSWHGFLGIMTVGYLVMQILIGMVGFVWFPDILRSYMSLFQQKLLHATSGIILYLMVSVSLMLGMLSNWFTSNVTGSAWYVCFMCPLWLALIVALQTTNSYVPRLRNRRG
ncbi:cytochrome b561 domain-containing protein 2-like [Lingula anatina]|uniref:ascorbate ferrireductase (transmembrane) n=1 Tax=Lingula anatina TaxID=7574 RepID=A0A1S3HQQ1_LINAN|nr:cytochrome b561 domain-containing protein 2-like [Lingula anatina]|eukprot:XP_013388383.1 cytochrome b561 domain-containing protein 2-like [Lingula anatina]